MVCAFSEDMSKNKLLGNFGLNLVTFTYQKLAADAVFTTPPPSSKKK